MDGRAWTMLLALSLLWGGSFLFQGVAVRELPTLTIVALRVALAALGLGIVLAALRIPMPRTLPVWRAFLVMGLLNNALPFSLIVWGQGQIASGLAAIFNATTPMFTILAAHVFTTDERITRAKLAGIGLGLIGVAVMFGRDALTGGGDITAQLAVLAAAASYALAGVWGRRFREMGVQPLATAAGQVTASSAILIPLALIVERPWTLAMPGIAAAASVVALALLSTALAYVFYFRILATAGATNLLLVTLMISPSAIAFGIAFLGESLAPNEVAGLGLIAAGLAVIDGRMRRRPWHRNAA
jgi:drug/metabolite transporter (DMT)-like permease